MHDNAAFCGQLHLRAAAGAAAWREEPTRNDRRCHYSCAAGSFASDPTRVTVVINGTRLAAVMGKPQSSASEDALTVARRLADGVPIEDVLASLRGRFALALLDAAAPRVQLATDRFAVLPLVIAVDGDSIVAADRADVLPGPARAIDPQALLRYLYFHCLPAPDTIYEGVRRLHAAELLTADLGGLRSRSHWLPAFSESWSLLPADRTPRFRQIIADAVQADVAGRDDAGCFLSGGTDSSTVAGMLREVTGEAPRAYSIGFDAEGYDEMSYARIAARHFGARHREYYVTPDDLVAAIPQVAAYYDQPFGNSSALPAYYCARMARDDGVGHLLAGDGGDELFGGNARYAKQKVFEAYFRLPTLVRRGLIEPLLLGSGISARLPLVRKARSYVAQATVPMPARMETYNLLNRVGVDAVLSDALRAQVDATGPEGEQAVTWARVTEGSLVNRMLAFDWQYTLADSDLPKVRGTAALAGTSVGFPMLDDALLDFSLAVPTDDKVRGQRLRHFFKEALVGFLPDEILHKKKHGFGLPFGVWLTRHAPLNALAADSLAGLGERNVLQPGFLKTVEGHLQTHAGYFGELIWVLMMLEQWLRARAPGWRVG